VARLQWYFDFLSPYSYLQFATEPELFQRSDVELKPLVLAALLDHWGQKAPAEIESKRQHTYRHVTWLGAKRGVPLRVPPAHPFNPIHALRLALAFGATYETVKSIFEFIWAQGRSPNDEWKALCDTLGVPGAEVLAASEGVKTQLRENGQEAINAGVFGVPTFVIDGRLFWGLDATGLLRDYLDDPQLFDSPQMQRLASVTVAATRKA
jgi:2-hydroxychromene-2-carboxylate isomerase